MAGRRQGAAMMMKGRGAHIDLFGEMVLHRFLSLHIARLFFLSQQLLMHPEALAKNVYSLS